mmetsp:Transcript_34280/g.90436  ORF Transcript_34280/g.90436 Transcript_34280/m.90436 type:complete len:104 (-) Transcript_34280:106-417(-)
MEEGGADSSPSSSTDSSPEQSPRPAAADDAGSGAVDKESIDSKTGAPPPNHLPPLEADGKPTPDGTPTPTPAEPLQKEERSESIAIEHIDEVDGANMNSTEAV